MVQNIRHVAVNSTVCGVAATSGVRCRSGLLMIGPPCTCVSIKTPPHRPRLLLRCFIGLFSGSSFLCSSIPTSSAASPVYHQPTRWSYYSWSLRSPANEVRSGMTLWQVTLRPTMYIHHIFTYPPPHRIRGSPPWFASAQPHGFLPFSSESSSVEMKGRPILADKVHRDIVKTDLFKRTLRALLCGIRQAGQTGEGANGY